MLASDEKRLFRIGGISALALAAGYVVITALYIPIGAPPSGPEARLAYIARHTTVWWVILALSVLTDFLFVPVALALYQSLKSVNKTAMQLATSCVLLFVVLDLAITWTNYAALILLSGQYSAASDAVRKAATIQAAVYPAIVLESTLLFVYNTLVLAIGILIAGFVMLNGPFSKLTAYLGIITGILGIVSVFGPLLASALSATIIVTSILTTVWLFFAGYRLLKLGSQ